MPDQNNPEALRDLEKSYEKLLEELIFLRSRPRGRFGYLLLMVGFVLVALSIDLDNYLIGFLSLTLIFMGGLFLYVRPTKFLQQSIAEYNLRESQEICKKIVAEQDYRGIPTYMANLSVIDSGDVDLFIGKMSGEIIPKTNTVEGTQNFIGSDFIKMTPLGLGLCKLIEDESRLNFSVTRQEYLMNIIRKIIIEDLELANKLDIRVNENKINFKIQKPALPELANVGIGIHGFLTSAIACCVAKSSNQPVIIENYSEARNGEEISFDIKIITDDVY
jgi:hypothetical protein